MKEFIKKVFYFDLIYNLTDIFYSNLVLFKHKKVFDITFDFWTLYFLVVFFLLGAVIMGVVKLLSLKTNKFIYESNKFICLGAFLGRGMDCFFILFLNMLYKKSDFAIQTFGTLINLGYEIIAFLILYYFWKYRIEICTGIFICGSLYAHMHLQIWFYQKFFKMAHPKEYLQGFFLLAVLVIFLLVTITLRKLGVYDFRGRKDKWLESLREGPYKRYSAKEN